MLSIMLTKKLFNFRMNIAVTHLPQHPNSRSGQAVFPQKVGVIFRDFALAVFRNRVVGVVARRDFQQPHRILDRAAHRPAHVVARIQWNDTGPAHQAQ